MSIDLGLILLVAAGTAGVAGLGPFGDRAGGGAGTAPAGGRLGARSGIGSSSPVAGGSWSGSTLGGLVTSLGSGRRREPTGAAWAGPGELAPLTTDVTDDLGARLVLGQTFKAHRWSSSVTVAAEAGQSVAVIGPTQSGKTTALAIPAILGWDGPVLAASVKTDLLAATAAWRRRQGSVWCFDPAGSTGLASDPWSPLEAARTWPGARRVAAALTEISRNADNPSADGEFWYATAAKLLAPLLFAAACGQLSMADVVRWVDTQEMNEPAALLDAAGVPEAVQAVQASWQREERHRSSVYTTAETVLEAFAEPVSPVPVASTPAGPSPGPIDATRLVSGPHTLYLCAPAHDQRRLRGLFTALVKEVLEAAFTRAARHGPLDPPLLVVLDEAANIAPLAELDGLAATCAGHGIQLVTVWQDMAQITARYGARAATVVNNHRAKVFLPGIADPGTLDHASHLVGEEELLVPSMTTDATGARSTTTSPLRRKLLPPDALRRMAPGTAVCLYGSLAPFRLRLNPWWEDPVLTGRGTAVRP